MADEGWRRLAAVTLSSLRLVGLVLAVLMASILLVFTYIDHDRLHDHNYHQIEVRTEDQDTQVQVIRKDVLPVIKNITPATWDYNWDRKAWKSPDEAQGVYERAIILVRHGQYDFDTGALTEKGIHQANWTGQRLKQLGMPYDSIVHSTLLRARQTAEYIHAHLSNVPITSDDMLREGGPVPPDPTLTYWGLSDRTYHVDGPRLEGAFRKYFHRADKSQPKAIYQILVGHGNIFRFFTLRALQLPARAWMRIFLPHGSITLMHINPDSTVTLTKFGDSGHFPPELVTI